MICTTCNTITSRVKIVNGIERCHNCGGFSEGGGARLDGILSRQRIRMDSVKYEGDVLNPWQYNKSEKAFVPNDEFLKRHAVNAHNYFTPDDLQKTHPKLASSMRNKQGREELASGEGDYIPEATKLIAST